MTYNFERREQFTSTAIQPVRRDGREETTTYHTSARVVDMHGTAGARCFGIDQRGSRAHLSSPHPWSTRAGAVLPLTFNPSQSPAARGPADVTRIGQTRTRRVDVLYMNSSGQTNQIKVKQAARPALT